MIVREIRLREKIYYLLYRKLPKNLFQETWFILISPIRIIWCLPLYSLLFGHVVYEIYKTSFNEWFEYDMGDDKYIIKNTKYDTDDDVFMLYFIELLSILSSLLVGYCVEKVRVGFEEIKNEKFVDFLPMFSEGILVFLIISIILEFIFGRSEYSEGLSTKIEYKTKEKND